MNGLPKWGQERPSEQQQLNAVSICILRLVRILDSVKMGKREGSRDSAFLLVSAQPSCILPLKGRHVGVARDLS